MQSDPAADRSLSRRGLVYLRWQRQRASRAAKQLAVIDLHRDVARGLYLSSWQRSGSTWLARIITSFPKTRLVYEPSNMRQQLYVGGEPHLVPLGPAGPGDDLGDDGIAIRRALAGTTSGSWTNPKITSRLPQRRVVKDIRTVGALPWIADAFPVTPMIFLIRHPMAVAHSILELGWSIDADLLASSNIIEADPALLERMRQRALLVEVGQWVAHHSYALRHPASARTHVILYEDLVRSPEAELDRLARYLKAFPAAWSSWTPDLAMIADASTTSFRRSSGTASEWIDSWSAAYSADTINEVCSLLDAAGIGAIYGADPNPLVGGSDVLAALTTD